VARLGHGNGASPKAGRRSLPFQSALWKRASRRLRRFGRSEGRHGGGDYWQGASFRVVPIMARMMSEAGMMAQKIAAVVVVVAAAEAVESSTSAEARRIAVVEDFGQRVVEGHRVLADSARTVEEARRKFVKEADSVGSA
jgi:hypothetical protein